MNEVSVTITAGEGCEEHNHGLEYRSKLEHTHDTNKDTVIELVPYEKSYKEQINELMKPYIKERNEYTLKRKAALGIDTIRDKSRQSHVIGIIH